MITADQVRQNVVDPKKSLENTNSLFERYTIARIVEEQKKNLNFCWIPANYAKDKETVDNTITELQKNGFEVEIRFDPTEQWRKAHSFTYKKLLVMWEISLYIFLGFT